MIKLSFIEFLTSIFFASDIEALGDRDYQQRQASYQRLSRFGVLAIPALELSLKQSKPSPDRIADGSVERQHRVRLLLSKLPDRKEWFASKLFNLDLQCPLKPSTEEALRRFGPFLCSWIDEHDGWWSGGTTGRAWDWVITKPYISGSELGDLIHCVSKIKEVQHRRLNPELYQEVDSVDIIFR